MSPLSPAEYQALVERAPMKIWRSNNDAVRDYFNPTWLAFTGRTLAQEIGTGWLEGVHPDDRGELVALERERFVERLPFERVFRLRRVDRVYRRVLERATPYTTPDGAFLGFIGSCADIGSHDDDGVFTSADEFFQRSLDNLCVARFDGYFERVNPAWVRTLGWTAEELLSRPTIELVHPDDRERTLAARGRLHIGSHMGPLVNRYLCKDGTYRWFEWRSIGHPERGLVYAAARDVTEQKEAEDRLREAAEREAKLQRQLIFADRMVSVGTLAAGVAHEINNPLAFVIGNVALIIEDLEALGTELPPDQRANLIEMATDVRVGADRIRKIVAGLKTFSRAEVEQLVAIDLRGVLEQAIDMTFNEIRHRARLVKDYGKTPFVEADEARLGQVFVNLLVNAAQAIPEGDTAGNEIRIATYTDATGRAVIEIRDSGQGIPAGILGRIFDPFFTTKPVGIGTGLGLSICHNIVTGLGGELTVASVEGSGTTFTVVLPPALDTAGEPVVEASYVPAFACASVLVVDDEPTVGKVLGRVLADHAVTAVTTAKEALDLLSAGKYFDIVFSDLMMPQMSGMDFFDELTRRFPDVARRVVFLSGGAFTPAAAAFLARVPNERLDKPFDVDQIRAVVQRVVG